MTDARLKARLRLWLRAERSMGLRVLPVSLDRHAQPQAATVAPRPAPQPAMVAAPSFARPAPPLQETRHQPPLSPSAAPALPLLGGLPLLKDAVDPPDAPFTAPPLPLEQKIAALRAMDEQEVRGCRRCGLCRSRTNTVFGEGNPDAQVFFIGEGPGANEDEQGRPFVGRAGQLLDKMIESMGLRREDVFIANIVKCRPPDNREPAPDEVAACTPYLERQLEIIRPKVIVTLGRPASQYMLKTKIPMGRLRGQWHTWRGIKLMPTFHPAYILRQYTPEVRGAVWSDLQKVMAELGLKKA